jgi:hypothetical protein
MVIATHGRAIWVMDDMRVAQMAGCGKPTTPVVIGPRPAIALNQYRDDEGNYTDFVASQPGGGFLSGGGPTASVFYWLPQEAKQRPTIDVYDASGHRIRHIEGEHDVFTGQEGSSYWISNTDGKNEFLYDFTTDGPARYESTAFFFRGPDEGPTLPPGRYTLAFHLDGKAYRFPIELQGDPQSATTQREYEQQFAARKRFYDLLGRIDVMLNQLHTVREQLVTEKAAVKTGDTATAAKVQTMIDATDAMTASLTSSPKNFEDSIQQQGQIREDAMALLNDEPLAQATSHLYARLESAYTQKTVSYDDWIRGLAGWNATLKGAGLKVVPIPATIAVASK